MLDHDDLFYCEGFAMFSDRSFPVIHAWVTDRTSIAIDNTWPQQAVAYAGVPFKSSFVNQTALTYCEILSLLGHFQNGYPLRNELGDRPDEWLERGSNGTGPIRPEVFKCVKLSIPKDNSVRSPSKLSWVIC